MNPAVINWMRGIACWLMIASHFGVSARVDAEGGWSSVAAMITVAGSFAPVIFFFCTGLGYSLKPSRGLGAEDILDLGKKALVLVLADHFFRITRTQVLGLDFLAFIGLSTFVVGCLAASRHTLMLTFLGIGGLLVARFAVKVIPGVNPTSFTGLDRWITGIKEVEFISYPLSPWMIFPLAGLLLGRWLFQPERRERTIGAGLLLGLLGLCAAATAALLLSSLPMSRWGFMSNGYFLVCLSALPCIVFIASALHQYAKGQRAMTWLLKVDGMTSLAIVPIHYGLIKIVAHSGWSDWAGAHYIWTYVALSIVSIWLSRRVTLWLDRLVRVNLLYPALVAACLGGGLLWGLWKLKPEISPDWVAIPLMLIGQIAACAILTARRTKPSKESLDKVKVVV